MFKAKNLRMLCYAVFFALITGCATTPPNEVEWQEGIPAKQFFIDSYNADDANHAYSTLTEYLIWIKRFYNGWIVFSQGWLDLTNKVLVHIDEEAPERYTELNQRMFALGSKISAEWAKDSNIRVIHSSNLITWWHATDRAIEENRVMLFADQIEHDVDALLKRQLLADDISMARYFTVNENDEFNEF